MSSTPCIIRKPWNGHRVGALVGITPELAVKLEAKGIVELLGKKDREDSPKLITKPMKPTRT